MRANRTMAAAAGAAALLLSACGGDEAPDLAEVEDTADDVIDETATEVAGTGAEQDLPPGDCDGEFAATQVEGDLLVGDGMTCVLEDVTVGGTIEVEQGGTLRATRLRVDGDLHGDGHADIQVIDSEVVGNVQLEEGGTATVETVQIGGNMQAESNQGEQVFQDNTIEGDLQCENNEPAPTSSGNVVNGEQEGQCASG